MAGRLVHWLPLLLAACRAPHHPPAADSRMPLYFLADDLAAQQRLREAPTATIREVTRYLIADAPTIPLALSLDASPLPPVAEDGTLDLLLHCPAAVAGRHLAYSVFFEQSPRALASAGTIPPASGFVRCPAAESEPMSIRSDGLPPGAKVAVSVVARADPAATVETSWLSPGNGAVLRTSLGLAPLDTRKAGARARFTLVARNRHGRSVPLPERELTSEVVGGPDWLDVQVDLDAAIAELGPEISLAFEATSQPADVPAFPVWGDPVVLGSRPADTPPWQ